MQCPFQGELATERRAKVSLVDAGILMLSESVALRLDDSNVRVLYSGESEQHELVNALDWKQFCGVVTRIEILRSAKSSRDGKVREPGCQAVMEF